MVLSEWQYALFNGHLVNNCLIQSKMTIPDKLNISNTTVNVGGVIWGGQSEWCGVCVCVVNVVWCMEDGKGGNRVVCAWRVFLCVILRPSNI